MRILESEERTEFRLLMVVFVLLTLELDLFKVEDRRLMVEDEFLLKIEDGL